MGLWNQGSGQYLDCLSMANSFEALDATINEVIGTGVVSGLNFTNTGANTAACSPGVVVAGHVLQLAVSSGLTFPAGTWDVYLCQPVYTYSGNSPVVGTYPGSNGIDSGVLTTVLSGTLPAAPGALLATIVSTGSAISSINNAPSGRNIIPGPAPTGTRTLYPAQSNFSSQPDGTAVSFTLTQTPNPSASLVVYKNGVVIDPTLYTITGTTVTFTATPLSSDKLSASMHY